MTDYLRQYWSIWYPEAGSTGLLVARGLLDPTDRLLVHAAPPVLSVEVSNSAGQRLAFGKDLEQTQDSPICLLRRVDERIEREDLWPSEEHYDLPLLLPGGEVGLLKQWWHAADQKEWCWQIELYNSKR